MLININKYSGNIYLYVGSIIMNCIELAHHFILVVFLHFKTSANQKAHTLARDADSQFDFLSRTSFMY